MLILKDEIISLLNTNMNFKTSILQESIKARKLGWCSTYISLKHPPIHPWASWKRKNGLWMVLWVYFCYKRERKQVFLFEITLTFCTKKMLRHANWNLVRDTDSLNEMKNSFEVLGKYLSLNKIYKSTQ